MSPINVVVAKLSEMNRRSLKIISYLWVIFLSQVYASVYFWDPLSAAGISLVARNLFIYSFTPGDDNSRRGVTCPPDVWRLQHPRVHRLPKRTSTAMRLETSKLSLERRPLDKSRLHIFYRQIDFPSEPGVANEILENKPKCCLSKMCIGYWYITSRPPSQPHSHSIFK